MSHAKPPAPGTPSFIHVEQFYLAASFAQTRDDSDLNRDRYINLKIANCEAILLLINYLARNGVVLEQKPS